MLRDATLGYVFLRGREAFGKQIREEMAPAARWFVPFAWPAEPADPCMMVLNEDI
jgi:hypothetical protein